MYKLEIANIIPQPNNNITIEFNDVSGDYPPYFAGQFLTLHFEFGDREVRRSYSFSSSPDVDEPLAVTVKRVENGEISRLLHHRTAVGDVLDVLAADGLFAYHPVPEQRKTLFLFAAGIGITPLFSILKTALVTEPLTKVVLAYSNSSPEKTVFSEELKGWQARYPDRLHIEWIFSNSRNLMHARLNRDYILEILKTHVVDSASKIVCYTCGPIFYMDLVRFTLLGAGIPNEDVKRETFHFPEEEEDDDEHEEVEIDKTTYQVTLNVFGAAYELQVPYDQSILDAGLKQKIRLPYSCKSGMCSTCISQVTSGAVRMDYNEVLTDREVESGKCLICTAHPTVDQTVIDIL